MKKQPITTREERKMKFAEAGVLFVLVLALTVFVGARLTSRDSESDAATASQTTAVTQAVVEADSRVAVTTAAEDTVIVESEAEAPQALAAEPPRVITYAMAEQTYFDGDYAGAAREFEAYTNSHGENAWGYYMLGLSNWKASDLDAAADAFETALELKPDHVKSLINYSRVLLEQDHPNAARAQIELALRQAPENVDANRMYSRICHSEGDVKAAAEGYLKVLQLSGDDVWSLNNLGLIRIEQGQFDAALAPLAKAAELDPEIACIQNNLGVALERTGHFTAAAAAFEMALNADANYDKASQSLDRVSELSEVADLEPVDLAALAAGFRAGPEPVTESEVAAVITEVTGDMDVATASANGDGDQVPE